MMSPKETKKLIADIAVKSFENGFLSAKKGWTITEARKRFKKAITGGINNEA